MSRESIHLDDALQAWLHEHSLRETDVQRALREAMESHPHGEMQTSPEQVQFMAMLISAIGGKRAIEVGVFTGYSAMAIAHALPADGELIACDVSEEYMAIAQTWWVKDGVADRITPRLGPAAESLEAMLADGEGGTYDFMYVDADKESSDRYYELGLQLLRPGGIIGIDNMFRGGRVVDPDANDSSTIATRAIAKKLVNDERIAYTLVPIGDGLALAHKLGAERC